MHKFITLISGRGSNLAAMCKAGLAPYISCVISNNPNAKGIEIAKKNNIPVCIVNHRDFISRENFEQAISLVIDNFPSQLIVLAGFMRIFSPWFIEKYPQKIINIHPSILPAFTGANAQQQAFDAKVKTTGATVHFITEKLDHGPIIASGAMAINHDNDDVDTLCNKILKLEHILYPFVIKKILNDQVKVLANGAVEVIKDIADDKILGKFRSNIHY